MSWLYKIATHLPTPPSELEQKIFFVLNEACLSMPEHPVIRAVGGWTRDKMLGKKPKDLDISVQGFGISSDGNPVYLKGIDFSVRLKQYVDQRYPGIMGEVSATDPNPDQNKNIGVARFKIFGQEIEVCGLRGNEGYGEKRQDVKQQTIGEKGKITPLDDAVRRDLTINSLFYNIKTGEVEDWTGNGLPDLQVMRLRPPERPYSKYQSGEYDKEGVPFGLKPEEWTMYEIFRVLKTEDPLRVLRILRFHARYPTSTIDAPVIQAMKDPELQRRIVDRIHNPNAQTALAQERVSGELRSMMSAVDPAKAIRIMADTGLLETLITPPNQSNKYRPLSMDQKNRHHDLNLIDHTVAVVRQTNELCKKGVPSAGIPPLSDRERMLMNFSALFHDVGKRDTQSQKPGQNDQMHYPDHAVSSKKQWEYFARAAKFSTDEIKFVSEVTENHMTPHTHIDESTGQPKVDDAVLREFVDKHKGMWKYFYLHAMADALSKSDIPDESKQQPYENMMQNIPSINGLYTSESGELELPELINGNEIQQIIKQPPGKIIGKILREVRMQQYKNFGRKEKLSINQLRELAIDYVKKHYRQLPIDGSSIIQIVGWPPQQGYVDVVKSRLRQEQDKNPDLTPQQALEVVKSMLYNGELNSYAPKKASVSIIRFV